MTPDINKTRQAEAKKPTTTESVDSLIAKKKQEKAIEGENVVQQSAEGVQGEVAEVMAGVEKPSEKPSEKKGESGEKGDLKGGGASDDDDSFAAQAGVASFVFPVEEVMVKKIRSVINAEIRMEMKKAEKLKKNLATGSAQEYNSTIARIRGLKEVLASLFTATISMMKNLYTKYFTTEGKRKSFEEI